VTEPSFGILPTPDEVRQACEEYYESRKYGFDLLEAPDSLLGWLISVLHGAPIPVQDIPDEKWDDFIKLLAPHQVLPYLYFLLRKVPPECRPPKNIMDMLQRTFLWSSYNTDVALRQATEITSACNDRGVRILAMKGLALAWTVYPHPATRVGSDIDLLVAPEQYAECRDVLIDLGYILRYDTFRVLPEFYHHACYFPEPGRKDQSLLEVHWRTVFLPGPGHGVSTGELIGRARKVETRSGPIYTFDPVDAFFYSAIHMGLSHEPMLRLSWVADIMYLAGEITARDLWPEVIGRSAEWEGRSSAERAVRLAGYWTGLEIPGEYDFPTWPGPGPGEEFALRHMRARREGRELLLHQIIAGMPTIPKKIRGAYHWTFRPDLIHDGYPDHHWWQSPFLHARMLYNNYQQIRR
jgi:hypothetical protein